jgi:hypothetical protein
VTIGGVSDTYSVTTVEGVVDYCTGKLGSYALYYDADHPDGTNKACVSGGTIDATLTSVTASGAAQSLSTAGTNGILWDGWNAHFVSIPIVSSGITSQNGRVEVDVTMGGALPSGSTVGIFEYGDDAPNGGIFAKLQYLGGSGYRLLLYNYSTGDDPVADTLYVPATINTTYHVTLDWNSTTGKTYAKIGAEEKEITGINLTAFVPGYAPTDPKFGARWSGNVSTVPAGFDNIKMGASQR